MKQAPLFFFFLACIEERNARIVMTTLLLTEQITREDRGSEGKYVLYRSSCSQITEEAEYVKKVFLKFLFCSFLCFSRRHGE